MTTKTIDHQGAQGDLLIRRVERLPAGLAERNPGPRGHVVAHSETGHHHVAQASTGATVRYYEPEDDTGPTQGLVAYLEVLDAHADLVHLRDWDTHEALRLPPGIYELRRQREYTPEGWRRVED